MVAGIALVGISMLVFSMTAMILAGTQSDESNPLFWFASLYSGFLQTIEQRHQEAVQYKETLGKDQTIIESLPDIEEVPSSSVESQELSKSIPQNKIEDSKADRNSFVQAKESEAKTISEESEETITEESKETTSDFESIQTHGGSIVKHSLTQSYQDPIKVEGQFDEESQSWQLSVSGNGFRPDTSLMVIISTVDIESSTIASFTVQTNGNGNFIYSPGTMYNNLETDLYQVKILGEGKEEIHNEIISFGTFPEDVITWNLNPASLSAGESATLQVFGQVNLAGPYFQNAIMIIEGDSQTESISLIVMPNGELYGTKELTFYEPDTFTVKVFYDSLVREGTLEVS